MQAHCSRQACITGGWVVTPVLRGRTVGHPASGCLHVRTLRLINNPFPFNCWCFWRLVSGHNNVGVHLLTPAALSLQVALELAALGLALLGDMASPAGLKVSLMYVTGQEDMTEK